MHEQDTPIDPANLPRIKEREGRDEIAAELAVRFREWESYTDQLAPRWENIERMIRNDPEKPQDAYWSGYIYRNIPVLSAKARAWQAYVTSAPCAANPYLVGTMFGPDAQRASDIETDFYMFMRKVHWDRTFRRAALSTGMYGKSFIRVRPYEHDGKPCFEHASISPRRLFFYPDDDGPITTKLNVGHSYDVRVGEIWEMQDQGLFYFDDRPTPDSEKKSSKEAPGLTNPSESMAKEEMNKPKRIVETFDLRDYGEGEKLYRVRFCPDGSPMLLGVYDYPPEYGRPWYFEMFLHEEEGRFLPETSRLNDIQELQLATNEQWNLMSAGSQMGAFPTTFVSGWAVDQKYRRAKPGVLIPTMNGGTASSIQTKFDPSVIPMLIADLDSRADGMMRLGGGAQGQESATDKTATAHNLRKLALDTAINDDLANLDICMSEIGAFMQIMYRLHYKEFQEAYGKSLAVQDPSVLAEEIMWEINGKSPANTPQAQQDAAMGLIQALTLFNPMFIQICMAAGIDWQQLMRAITRNSNLDNKTTILKSDAELTAINQAANAAVQQQEALGAIAATQPGATNGVVPDPGMAMGAGGVPPAVY